MTRGTASSPRAPQRSRLHRAAVVVAMLVVAPIVLVIFLATFGRSR